jgi:hypothetical protein
MLTELAYCIYSQQAPWKLLPFKFINANQAEHINKYEILGSHSSEDVDVGLLGCNAVWKDGDSMFTVLQPRRPTSTLISPSTARENYCAITNIQLNNKQYTCIKVVPNDINVNISSTKQCPIY